MGKPGRPHPDAVRVLQWQYERDLVGTDYLDRVYLAVDRALHHPRDKIASDAARSVERHIFHLRSRYESLTRHIELKPDDRFSNAHERQTADKRSIVIP